MWKQSNNNYESFSLSLITEYQEALEKSKERLFQYKEIQQYVPYISILPIQWHLSHHGEASVYGIIGLSQNILQNMQSSKKLIETLSLNKTPQNIIDFLLIHESLHTIFSITFQNLYQKHKDILEIFHRKILPETASEDKELSYNKEYICEKYHVSLSGTHEKNVETFLEKYFDALKKDMIIETRIKKAPYILPYSSNDLFKKYQTTKTIAVEILYNQDKQSFIKKTLTGMYAWGDLEKRIKSFNDLYREEGMVNYIAWLLTDTDVMEVNRYCKQDNEKLNLTKKLQQKWISVEECFTKIRTWQDINNIY